MKTLILRCLALGLLPALLAWPTTALWADENPAVPATTPDQDFKFYPQDADYPNDGTTYHKKTGLTWKRCAEGQSWSWDQVNEIGTCTGTASTYTWQAALSLATDGWRLPNQKELNSILELARVGPAINATVFPYTPSSWPSCWFWSASTYAPNATAAWMVDFGGGLYPAFWKGYTNAVRLVRGGQYSLLSVDKAGTGSGTVTSNPPGIDCGKYCKGSFANEMFARGQIILTASPDDGSVFDGWTDDCPIPGSGDKANECTVTLQTAKDTNVTANFSPKNVTPTLSINDVSERERNHGAKTPFIFKVTLSSASTHPVTVYYVTANGTAKAGSDYTATIGMLWFARGQTTRVVKVDVNPDTKREPNETFFVNLRWASGATILDGQGLGTILNDD
jgi:hypothetical protein